MITRIEIDGFKSFQNFEMDFTPLTVVAGTNASGKSNLFDALQLLSNLAESDLKTAFGKQRGNASELFTQYGENHYATEMKFAVEMLVNRKIKDNWGAEAELKYTRLRYSVTIQRRINNREFEELFVIQESLVNLKHMEDSWIKNNINKNYIEFWRPKVDTGKRGIPYIYTDIQNNIPTFYVPQDGTTGKKRTLPALEATQTVLSSFNTIDFPHVLAAKEEMRKWKFLQLNPEDLREPTRHEPNTSDKITSSGKNLAAALYRIKQEDEYNLIEISRKLNSFLPEFTEVQVTDDKANRQIIITLKGEDDRIFTSRVLSEGTLRILALCIFLYDNGHNSLLCLEEPENGIHPFRVKTIAQLIKDLSTDFEPDNFLRQIIVNTHSPVLLSEILKWFGDNNVSVWFSHLATLVTKKENRSVKMKISKIEKVYKENEIGFEISEQNRKLTINTVIKYLEKLSEIPNFAKD